MKKIIHIALGKANPDRLNGVNKVVNELANHQAKLGYHVELWGITKTPEIHNYSIRDYSTKLFHDISKFKLSNKLVKAIKTADQSYFFHIHGAFIPQFFLIAKLLAKLDLQYCYTSHGAFNKVALRKNKIVKYVYLNLFEKTIVKNAKYLHLMGESELINSRLIFNKSSLSLIPNGQKYEQTIELVHSAVNKVLKLGFIGRIDIQTKGLDKLLYGLSEYIFTKSDQVILEIIGDGNDKEELNTIITQLGLDKYVHVMGPRFNDEKNKFIKEWDYICLTSRNEGLPGVILESASFGTPCIISKETNLEKAVNKFNSGITLHNNTASNICQAILKAHQTKNDNTLKYKQTNARKMIIEDFNWSLIAKKHIENYEK